MKLISRAGGLAAAALALALNFAAPAMAREADATVVDPATKPAAIPNMIQPLPTVQSSATNSERRLHDLVISWVDYGNQDAEQECLAGAVYFEARGEPLEGQLAVAQVVLNRARSGIYPSSICGVVTQPAQFSFIRGGKFPTINRDDDNWHKAKAVADIATKALVQEIQSDVLWYHADYVAPGWGTRLTRAAQIGRHIFYQQG